MDTEQQHPHYCESHKSSPTDDDVALLTPHTLSMSNTLSPHHHAHTQKLPLFRQRRLAATSPPTHTLIPLSSDVVPPSYRHARTRKPSSFRQQCIAAALPRIHVRITHVDNISPPPYHHVHMRKSSLSGQHSPSTTSPPTQIPLLSNIAPPSYHHVRTRNSSLFRRRLAAALPRTHTRITHVNNNISPPPYPMFVCASHPCPNDTHWGQGGVYPAGKLRVF
jgi:hypothetical protein